MPQTYQPMFDLSAEFPSLITKTAVLLHPRRATQPLPIDASKFGGQFLWPRNEPWPRCADDDNSAMVPVLQINKRDISELPFPNGSDLLQILWCPYTLHDLGDIGCGPKIHFVWRNTSDSSPPFLSLEEIPEPNEDVIDEEMTPVECKLHPERVKEYPDIGTLELENNYNREFLSKIEEWIQKNVALDVCILTTKLRALGHTDLNQDSLFAYCSSWSASPSCKVGGYPTWIDNLYIPKCSECNLDMQLMISISSNGGYRSRWLPIDEKCYENQHNTTQLDIECGGVVYLYVCRQCSHSPIRYFMMS